MVLTAPKRDIFDESGPSHLTHIDWTNEDHRRSVAASLVQGTYMLELDRQAKREGPQALAPPWYEFFHYNLVRHLIDDVDSTIFAAIFEHMPPTASPQPETKQSPHYIIAFRGTLTNTRDLTLDLHIIKNELHNTSRFLIAMEAVRDTVSAVGESDSDIWLAGHSLGSAMAILAGRDMAKSGIFLTTFLFNPPFVSAPLELIEGRRLKHVIRVASSVLTAGLVVATKAHNNQREGEAPFVAMAEWVPSLFVNRGDHICSEYIGYFEHRVVMEEIGVGGIGKLATQNSIGGLVMSVMGKELLEPMHLIPSARVCVNASVAGSFREAHGIHQWWRPGLDLESKVYKYV